MKQIILCTLLVISSFSLHAMEKTGHPNIGSKNLEKGERRTLLPPKKNPEERYCCNEQIHKGFAIAFVLAGCATSALHFYSASALKTALEACANPNTYTYDCAKLADDLNPWQTLLPLSAIILLGGLALAK